MDAYINSKAKYLFPAYFAMVMTAGTLSIGTYLLDFSVISLLLLYINTVAYIALWGLTLIRLFKYFPRFRKDMMSHEKRSEEHTSELQSRFDLVCRLLLEKK